MHALAPGVKNVSSSFGKQIARSAIIAVLFSLLVITLYIAVRFKGIAFAVPVIVALIHDVVITIGVYSVTGREVTESTVAAILTVLGYSIYDTIIIFDRIRENIPIMRRASFATIANVSLWETIRRSLATTFITLLPVLALFFFGGSTLKDFAFALLVGVAVGCLLVDLHRGAAPDHLQGARAGVRAPQGQPLDAKGRSASGSSLQAEAAAAAEPAPDDADRRDRAASLRRRLRREARSAQAAAQVAAAWPCQIAPTAKRSTAS